MIEMEILDLVMTLIFAFGVGAMASVVWAKRLEKVNEPYKFTCGVGGCNFSVSSNVSKVADDLMRQHAEWSH